MKGWKLVAPFKLKEKEIAEGAFEQGAAKVKMTKALITLSDVLRFKGDLDANDVVLGSSGIGVISDVDANLFGLEKGKHVYVEPARECNECYNCKIGEPMQCTNIRIAGEDFDGFLTDFTTAQHNKLYILPDNVSDFDALFIKHVSLAISIVDKLKIQKGDYVAIIGSNNFGNILAQLIIYYQAVPIVLATDDEDYRIAKESGIYYVLDREENWAKEVSNITSGRMAKNVVYIADSDIPVTKAFNLAASNAKVAYTGSGLRTSPVHFTQAVKKNLEILCISSDFRNTATSINLLANKAINLSCLKIESSSFADVPSVFKKLSDTLEEKGKIYETVVEMI